MQYTERLIGDIPWPIRAALFVGGALMSAFSSKFSDAFQTLGLWAGIVIAALGVIATVWHVAKRGVHGGLIARSVSLLVACLLWIVGLSLWASGGDWEIATSIFGTNEKNDDIPANCNSYRGCEAVSVPRVDGIDGKKRKRSSHS